MISVYANKQFEIDKVVCYHSYKPRTNAKKLFILLPPKKLIPFLNSGHGQVPIFLFLHIGQLIAFVSYDNAAVSIKFVEFKTVGSALDYQNLQKKMRWTTLQLEHILSLASRIYSGVMEQIIIYLE